MSNFFISTAGISAPVRNSVMKVQTELARVQKELASGRLADVGLSLGGGVTELGQLRHSQAWQDALGRTNALAAARLDMSQKALDGAGSVAQDFLNQLLAAKGSITSASAITNTAKHALVSLTGQMNTEIAGVHVFAGENTAEIPLASFDAPGSAASTGIANAFAATFGFALGDPAAGSITPTQMQAFLDGPFAAEFSDANWGANWSKASSQNSEMKIAVDQVVEVGANANEAPVRKLAQAYVMVSVLGTEKLSATTLDVVLDKASSLASSGITGVTTIRARLGSSQERISAADEHLAAEGQVIVNRLNKMEQADLYKATTAANTLMTQLQASYSATARLQQMSIVNFL